MKRGIWKEYKKEDNQSYRRLYKDIQGSACALNMDTFYSGCYSAIHGAIDGEFWSGDIYVYFENDEQKDIPIFFIKVSDGCTPADEEESNKVEFNGSNVYGYEIDCKFFPELIKKLREIDEKKNKEYIDELEKEYANYQRLLSLQKKRRYTEEELVFLYSMTSDPFQRTIFDLATNILAGRDIQTDFDSLKLENKVELFLAIKETPLVKKLLIDSKEVLLALAQRGSLKQLANAPQEIIVDKKYIMSVLNSFFKADELGIRYFEFESFLPSQYQSDLDVITLAFYNYTSLIGLGMYEWKEKNPKFAEEWQKPEFCYQVMDIFARSQIEKGEEYYENHLMRFVPEQLRNNILEHILIGPEKTYERQKLKDNSIKVLKKEIDGYNKASQN